MPEYLQLELGNGEGVLMSDHYIHSFSRSMLTVSRKQFAFYIPSKPLKINIALKNSYV